MKRLNFTTTHPQTQSRFFTLPAELRNEIYTMVFSEVPTNKAGKISTHSVHALTSRKSKQSVLSIACACRWTYLETLELFYSMYHFSFDLTHPWHDRVYSNPTHGFMIQPAAIQEATMLAWDIEEIEPTCWTLGRFKSLKHLHFTIRTTFTLEAYRTGSLRAEFHGKRKDLRFSGKKLPKSVQTITLEFRQHDLMANRGGMNEEAQQLYKQECASLEHDIARFTKDAQVQRRLGC
ncbi:uncharacterized protein LTR77_004206 [Saxophila tyrrhenica]|uniref:Uncharacterized protein n=1 Tax=Saxophila tyrrhenica TaxID=1690608 RepID=A0AAV9PC51_9PEZI|nr:hypothetical protein LTR77_004206 [Saxophila tyrrhenica]